MKKIVSILGSTGSIGVNTLDIISRHPDDFSISGLAAGRNVSLLSEQIERFRPKIVSVLDSDAADELQEAIGSRTKTAVRWGMEGYLELAAEASTEVVVSAMVGAAGLLPTWEAIAAGKDIALANKETLVTAGPLVIEKAAERGVKILPVDSEHSAVFQCIEGQSKAHLKRIILTASGGPFLNTPKEALRDIKPEDALKHPNWKMGRKITIDSATMMNKGLEVIEARWLFGIDFDRIDIVIHPQSIVHSLVEYTDGSVLAQMGVPDMRVPISYALYYPDRAEMNQCSLELTKAGKLEFREPDFDRFPGLRLAYEAGREGGTMTAVLNAANETAVENFVTGKIAFTDITLIIERTMKAYRNSEAKSIQDILTADQWARKKANSLIQEMQHV